MRAAKYQDRDEAVRALLHMIDSQSQPLPVAQKEREVALKDLIETNQLSHVPATGKSRRRMLFTPYKLEGFITSLTTQLQDGLIPTIPKNRIIWENGSRVIKSEYLKSINFEIGQAGLGQGQAKQQNSIDAENSEDPADQQDKAACRYIYVLRFLLNDD